VAIGLFFGFLLYSITSPMAYSNTGFIFYYPLYDNFSLRSLFTTGTWIWIFTLVYISQNISNKIFNKKVFWIVTGPGMWAYISHYLWIVLIVVKIIRPLNISFAAAIIISFTLTELIILTTYLIFKGMYSICCHKIKL
jgi:hypothetical protein